MGIRNAAEYMAWRETRATELIGPYAVKTAGALMVSDKRITVDGWLYSGRDAMCFFADDPAQLVAVAPPGMVDSRTLVIAYQDCDEPVITAPGAAPNAILHFGGKKEFVGASARMLEIARMWFMWAVGSLGSDIDWDTRYNEIGSPLRTSKVGLSRKAKNTVSAIAAVVISVYVLGTRVNVLNSSVVETIALSVGSFVISIVTIRGILTLIPKYGHGHR